MRSIGSRQRRSGLNETFWTEYDRLFDTVWEHYNALSPEEKAQVKKYDEAFHRGDPDAYVEWVGTFEPEAFWPAMHATTEARATLRDEFDEHGKHAKRIATCRVMPPPPWWPERTAYCLVTDPVAMEDEGLCARSPDDDDAKLVTRAFKKLNVRARDQLAACLRDVGARRSWGRGSQEVIEDVISAQGVLPVIADRDEAARAATSEVQGIEEKPAIVLSVDLAKIAYLFWLAVPGTSWYLFVMHPTCPQALGDAFALAALPNRRRR